MVKVYRGYEKIPFKEQVKWPDRGRYFFDNPRDAKWYAQRAKTLSGKISSLDLTSEQFDKAKKLSRSRTTLLYIFPFFCSSIFFRNKNIKGFVKF